ncbi:hypothetical protein RV11_GL002692 [Enterococcus phoeniculicola]|jgi:activator of the mannose operon (transcriptional antiterminator)|uniref:PRD domain-containing protein n=1 Tax=Enterococcus phoeniculicola ATCC BAA-412 TaxID=1158610 RepID=R3WIR0_9ENTE|nr:PRD domain-containing protein [Enterococcus phoeniculicola]EOL41780.1 hypothetical protein UC3_03345 [Enterococcus phoeniculicola ATCC BAA-412]EOT78726.1 hypothetical protein I589_00231 [Enterococcus phoeniculicola ATCC BAA-412]OJG72553.1 hypothetical protein RV11_GL002692 [Enterococcus phoeniculicola]
MKLSKKESELLELFVLKDTKLTAKEIAESLNISSKTVYRLVHKINEASEFGILIETYIGKGMKMNYRNYLKYRSIFKQSGSETEERVSSVLMNLLSSSPLFISIENLFKRYFISSETQYKDLEKIKKKMKQFDLLLERKENKIRIIGKEQSIRKAIYHMLLRTAIVDTDFYVIDNKNISQYDIDFLTAQLELIEKKIKGNIPYPYNINIFSHLYILVMRIRNGFIPKNREDKTLDAYEVSLKESNQEIYGISQKIVGNLSHYLSEKIDQIEEFYLFQYIISSGIEEQSFELYSDGQLKLIFEDAIDFVSQHMALDFSSLKEDKSFFNHFRVMLYRNKNKIVIVNNLLGEIKKEYPELFKSVEKLSHYLSSEYSLAPISEDESGFTMLYFAKDFEKLKTKKRVIIMCSSGVGTSELLKVKVQRNFPTLDIIDVVSVNQFKKKYMEEKVIVDFIISTINITLYNLILEVPVALVSAMFTGKDQETIRLMMEGI